MSTKKGTVADSVFYTYLSLKQRIDCGEFFYLAKLGKENIAML
jgi:hypothetical protein